MAFIHDWGFDLGWIKVPVAIWHGEETASSPSRTGARLADNVSIARSCLRAGEVHISPAVSAYGQILDQLTSTMAPRRTTGDAKN